MKVKIISVHNQGDFNKEYVLMEVYEDCNIGDFILADSTYTSGGQISNKVRHTYWIPDKQVEEGDLVSVWTKSGTKTTTTNANGITVHRFYWGLDRAVWNDEGDCAVLFELKDWQHFPVK
jgi:hypothetical protein